MSHRALPSTRWPRSLFTVRQRRPSIRSAWHSGQQAGRYPVKVFELIPPMVDTNLDKGARKARGQTYFGMSTAAFIVPAMKSFANDEVPNPGPGPQPAGAVGRPPGRAGPGAMNAAPVVNSTPRGQTGVFAVVRRAAKRQRSLLPQQGRYVRRRFLQASR